MEATGIATGAEAGTGTEAPQINSEAFFSGASPESVMGAGEQPVTEAPETPAPPAEAPAPKEGEQPAAQTQETKPEESPDQTAEESAEPLPQKIEDLLKAVKQANPKLGAELNKLVREDHFLLHGEAGFLSAFPGGMDEAREYKSVAPTVEDLRVLADYAQRYDGMDRQYVMDPPGLIRTLAEDREAFTPVLRSFEPTLRQMDPGLYAEMAKPFNANFWQNIMSRAQQEGTPEEVELLQAIQQKWLGPMGGNGQGRPSPLQGTPELQELQQLREWRDGQKQFGAQNFFQTVNTEAIPTVRGEVRNYLAQKIGSGLPEAVRDEYLDEMADAVSSKLWQEINGNPIIKSELERMIEGGDFSTQHKQAVMERIMTRAKAALPTKSAPEITRIMGRIRKLQGGNANATKQTNAAGSTANVGSGSPSVGSPVGAPKGFPPGWNVMNANQRADSLGPLVNWRATDANGDSDEIFMAVCATGKPDPRLVLKAR